MQRERADEGGGRVAGLLQQRGGGARARAQPVAAVVADAMLKRIDAGQDRRVRRQRRDGVRVRELEAHAIGREPIEGRRRRRPTVAAERVRAQRVDCDEQDVLMRDRAEIGRLRRARDRRKRSEKN